MPSFSPTSLSHLCCYSQSHPYFLDWTTVEVMHCPSTAARGPLHIFLSFFPESWIPSYRLSYSPAVCSNVCSTQVSGSEWVFLTPRPEQLDTHQDFATLSPLWKTELPYLSSPAAPNLTCRFNFFILSGCFFPCSFLLPTAMSFFLGGLFQEILNILKGLRYGL